MAARGIRDDMQQVNPVARPVTMPQRAAPPPEPRALQPRIPLPVNVAPRVPAPASSVSPSAGVIGSALPQSPPVIANPAMPAPSAPGVGTLAPQLTTGAPTGGINPAAPRPIANTQPVPVAPTMRV
jgi:hypothetical protein